MVNDNRTSQTITGPVLFIFMLLLSTLVSFEYLKNANDLELIIKLKTKSSVIIAVSSERHFSLR